MKKRLKKCLKDTSYADSPMVATSANSKEENVGISELISKLSEIAFYPNRNNDAPLVLAVDHCFGIKGKGTILTGTVLQGSIKVDDEIELPGINITKKVKSLQMFRQSVTTGFAGDRLGVCVTQFNPTLMERGIACLPGYAYYICCGVITADKIKHFKGDINSKSKFHLTIGHETVLANVICFNCENDNFNFDYHFRYMDKLSDVKETSIKEYLLLQFEKPVLVVENCRVIGSKLDLDKYANDCRLAFSGLLISSCKAKESKQNYLNKLKIYKEKIKVGKVDRVLNENSIIVKNLVKREASIEFYKDLKVTLSTGETGVIRDSFGRSGKVKVEIVNGHVKNQVTENKYATVTLMFKKYMFITNNKIAQ